MKISVDKYEDHCELKVVVGDQVKYQNTYKNMDEVNFFLSGFTTCQHVINGLVQSFPLSPTIRDMGNFKLNPVPPRDPNPHIHMPRKGLTDL